MTELAKLPTSEALFETVRGETDTILLAFSGGKDSLAMWLWLRDRIEITPYFMYLVPDLESDEVFLDYYEKWFGCKIHRMPHPILYQALNDLVYQPPNNVAKIWAMSLPNFNFADVDQAAASQFIKSDAWYCAVGMRATDNLDRRYMIMQRGVLGKTGRRFYYAIWDWNVQRVFDEINRAGVRLPAGYHTVGRTVTSLQYQYLKPIKNQYPGDYRKIAEYFPLVEAEFFRWDRLYEKN